MPQKVNCLILFHFHHIDWKVNTSLKILDIPILQGVGDKETNAKLYMYYGDDMYLQIQSLKTSFITTNLFNNTVNPFFIFDKFL